MLLKLFAEYRDFLARRESSGLWLVASLDRNYFSSFDRFNYKAETIRYDIQEFSSTCNSCTRIFHYLYFHLTELHCGCLCIYGRCDAVRIHVIYENIISCVTLD